MGMLVKLLLDEEIVSLYQTMPIDWQAAFDGWEACFHQTEGKAVLSVSTALALKKSKFVVCVDDAVMPARLVLVFGKADAAHKAIAQEAGFTLAQVLAGGQFEKGSDGHSFAFTGTSLDLGFVPAPFLAEIWGDKLKQQVGAVPSADKNVVVSLRNFLNGNDSFEGFVKKCTKFAAIRELNEGKGVTALSLDA